MKMRNNWALGFLGFLGFYSLAGLIRGDWLQSVWIVLFACFSWFIPPKKDEPGDRKSQKK